MSWHDNNSNYNHYNDYNNNYNDNYNQYDEYNADYGGRGGGRGRNRNRRSRGRGSWGRGGTGRGRGGNFNNFNYNNNYQQQQGRAYHSQQQQQEQHTQSEHLEFPTNLDELLKNIGKKSKSDIIEIDGSKLEGGGQILRNAMTFAALLKQPIHIKKIRGGRAKPGLASQHLQGIVLTQKIFGGYLSGAYLKSMEILYIPAKVEMSKEQSKTDFMADTETAGSVCLLLQSSLPLLFYMPFACNILLKGGTNASFAPQIDYFELLVKPMFHRLFGLSMNIKVNKRGFYPKGGGEVNVSTKPLTTSNSNDTNENTNKNINNNDLKMDENDEKKNNNNNNNINNENLNEELYLPSINMCKRGKLTKIRGMVILGGNSLDLSIGNEIRAGALSKLCENKEFKEFIDSANDQMIDIGITREFSLSYGTAIVLVVETQFGCILGGSALGKASPSVSNKNMNQRKGRNYKNTNTNIDYAAVGKDAAKELLVDWNHSENACTDRHFQDQLIIFMALAKGESKFKTCELELHTETAIHFAQLLTGAKFKVTKENDGTLIECQGIGLPAFSSTN